MRRAQGVLLPQSVEAVPDFFDFGMRSQLVDVPSEADLLI
jgi:hypothetical protein